VEAYPHDTGGKKVSASFLDNGTRRLFEQVGFSYDRRKDMNHCVMSKAVPRAKCSVQECSPGLMKAPG
jgi:hypothetical protein